MTFRSMSYDPTVSYQLDYNLRDFKRLTAQFLRRRRL